MFVIGLGLLVVCKILLDRAGLSHILGILARATFIAPGLQQP